MTYVMPIDFWVASSLKRQRVCQWWMMGRRWLFMIYGGSAIGLFGVVGPVAGCLSGPVLLCSFVNGEVVS